jgi:hypothetical protein
MLAHEGTEIFLTAAAQVLGERLRLGFAVMIPKHLQFKKRSKFAVLLDKTL